MGTNDTRVSPIYPGPADASTSVPNRPCPYPLGVFELAERMERVA